MVKRKTQLDGLTDDEACYGRLLPVVKWWRRLWCFHRLIRGNGIYYCKKCDYWEH